MVQPSTFSRHYQAAADLAAGSHKMSRWSGTLWELYAQSAALCSTLSEVKRCWAVGLCGRCCNTRAGALMGTSVWDLLRGTLIKHDLLKPGWIINPFSVDALPYLDYAWPYEEVWERLLFILHYIECQNSATGLAKHSSLAEKGWLRRSFCLLNSLDSDSSSCYFKLGADIAFLVLHQSQSPS